jgi:hypothetical protein
MQNDGQGNITVGSGSNTTAALRVKGNVIIENGGITGTNDLYLNNNKTGGDIHLNTDSLNSKVFIDNGQLFVRGIVTEEIKGSYDLNVTTRNESILYLNKNKGSGDIRLNNNCLNSNVIIDNGNLIIDNGNLMVTKGTVKATEILQNSDYRLKDNIRCVEKFTTLNLRPVQYELKSNNKTHIGFIAHELQEQFPMLVIGEKDGKEMQTINYTELIPVLIKDIQRLNQIIIDNDAKSESRISNLESRISNLE